MKLITGSRALSIMYGFFDNYRKLGNYTLLLPPNICHDVFFLINYMKLSYIIVDLELTDFCINRQIVINHVKKNGRSILLFNHTYGIPAVPYSFFKQLKNISPDAVIIDDRCLCSPVMKTNIDDYCIDLIVYSTGHCKQVDLGRWSFGFVNDAYESKRYQINFETHQYSKIKKSFYAHTLKTWKDCSDYYSCIQISDDSNIDPGFYEKLILEDKEKWQKHKSVITEIYKSSLPPEIQLRSDMNNWRFNILVKKRDIIIKELLRNNLYASTHYLPIGIILNRRDCTQADQLYQNILNLFIDKNYTPEKAKKTVAIIIKTLA